MGTTLPRLAGVTDGLQFEALATGAALEGTLLSLFRLPAFHNFSNNIQQNIQALPSYHPYHSGVILYYQFSRQMNSNSKRGPPPAPPRSNLAKELIDFNKERMAKAYAFPSSLQQAEIHEIANYYGYNSLVNYDGTPASICPCCQLPINTQELPLNYETTPDVRKDKLDDDEEYKLSSGISMFFTFIKMAICYLILRFILTDAFNLISSATAGSYCRIHGCDSFITGEISSYNKISEQGLVFALDILNLITIIFSIAFFNLYRKVQYRIEMLINSAQHTQEDYSLFLNGIPILLIDSAMVDPDQIKFDYAQKLKKYFQAKLDSWMAKIADQPEDSLEQIQRQFLKAVKGKRLADLKKVTSVTMCFDLAEMEVLREMRSRLMEKYVDTVAAKEKEAGGNQLVEEEQDPNSFQNVLTQITLINQEEILLSQKFAEDSSMAFNLTHFVGRAFISFQYQHFRDYIQRQYSRDSKNFLLIRPDYPIQVQFASAPADILWYNMSVQQSTRRKYIFIAYLILLMVLAFAFGGTLLMTKLKYQVNQNKDPSDDVLTPFLTSLMTVVTLIINYILGVIVKHLTEYERHQTKSNFIFSHVVKVVLSQFLNTTILYYVAANVTHSPYLSEEGLVVQVSNLFITSAVIQVGLNALNTGATTVFFKKWLKYRNKTQISMFQKDLNQEMQRAEFQVVDRYSYYILQIYACSFYAYLTPVATPCLILTLIAQYWIDKYNLFKRSSCKNEMDFSLSRILLKIFEASLFLAALGSYIFSIVLHNNYVNSVNVATLIITGVYTLFLIFAPRHLQRRLFGSYEQIQTKAYSECMKEKLFAQRYWTSNPATKFVREVDMNTKMEVSQTMPRARFAVASDLKQAKQQLEELLNKEEEPRLELNDSFRSGKPSERVNRSTIRDSAL